MWGRQAACNEPFLMVCLLILGVAVLLVPKPGAVFRHYSRCSVRVRGCLPIVSTKHVQLGYFFFVRATFSYSVPPSLFFLIFC